MKRRLSFFILHFSFFIAAAAAAATPSGIFDTAAYQDGWLVNNAWNDSRYTLPVSVGAVDAGTGAFLDIALRVRVAPSNAVHVTFGDGLRVANTMGCWIVTAGDDALPFSHHFPQGTYGEQALGLRVRISGAGDILAVTADPPAHYVSPLPAWQGVDPGLWDGAEISLRGAGSAIGSVAARRRPQPSLILVR